MSIDIQGTVTQVNDKGIKIEGYEGWYNYTRAEWREEPWVEDVHVGDVVKLGLDKGGHFVRSIILIEVADPPPWDKESPPPPASPFRSPLSIIRQGALEAAVDVFKSLGGGGMTGDILSIATAFEEWILREEK